MMQVNTHEHANTPLITTNLFYPAFCHTETFSHVDKDLFSDAQYPSESLCTSGQALFVNATQMEEGFSDDGFYSPSTPPLMMRGASVSQCSPPYKSDCPSRNALLTTAPSVLPTFPENQFQNLCESLLNFEKPALVPAFGEHGGLQAQVQSPSSSSSSSGIVIPSTEGTTSSVLAADEAEAYTSDSILEFLSSDKIYKSSMFPFSLAEDTDGLRSTQASSSAAHPELLPFPVSTAPYEEQQQQPIDALEIDALCRDLSSLWDASETHCVPSSCGSQPQQQSSSCLPSPPSTTLTQGSSQQRVCVVASSQVSSSLSPPPPSSLQQQVCELPTMSLPLSSGVGGRHYAAPVVLVHPEEFRNPSSFLKVYGDPLCGRTSTFGSVVTTGRNGNWTCARCGNVNYPRRFRCNKCNEVRDAEGDTIVNEYVLLVYQQHLKTYKKLAASGAGGRRNGHASKGRSSLPFQDKLKQQPSRTKTS